MKISPATIDSFIQNDINSVNTSLLYGPDQGLISERQNIIIKKILGDQYDPMTLIKLDANYLVKNPAKLHEEINNISLIPGKRLFIIYNVTNNFYKIIKEILDDTNNQQTKDNFIILTAGELSPSSSIRKYFETTKHTVAIPCYIDDPQTIYNIVKTELSYLNPNNEIIQYIANNISGNRLIIKQELEKIKTFYLSSQSKTIEINDIKLLLTESHANDFQDFANSVADKDTKKSIHLLDDLLSSGFPSVTLIRVLINYLYRILELKSLIDKNSDFNSSIKQLKPPVFFKQKNLIKKHLNLWHIKELELIIQKLTELEITCKTYSTVNTHILVKFFILIISKKKTQY